MTLEEDLIHRYKARLKTVYSNPNPYYQQPLFEYSEIEAWIEKLKKNSKNK